MTPAELLAFEHHWPHHTPDKTHAIRHELGITETRFYVLLSRAARSLAGIQADPVTARRVREREQYRASERERRVA